MTETQNSPGETPSPGIFRSLKNAFAVFVASFHTRLELFVTELEEERERLKQTLVLTLLLFFGLGLGFILLNIFVVALFWQRGWILAIGALAAIYLAVGVDSAISQKWPVRPLLVNASPINGRSHNLFVIERSLCNDFAIRPAYEALSPEFNAFSAGGRFVSNAVRHCDVASISDGMTPLNRFPGGMLRFSKFLFLARMPADCRRIKNNLCAAQSGQSCSFRIPLVPANTDADPAPRSVPRSKSKIARREVKLFVIQRIIGNMHFAIFTEQLSVRVDDCGRVVIKPGAAPLKKRCDDYCAGLPGDVSQRRSGFSRHFLGQSEVLMILCLTKVLRTKKLRQANNLRALSCRFTNESCRAREILFRVDTAAHLD